MQYNMYQMSLSWAREKYWELIFALLETKNNFVEWPLHYLVSCLEDSDEVRSLLASQDREEEEAGSCSVESAVSCSQAMPQLPVPAA